jgi:hypothetical protein
MSDEAGGLGAPDPRERLVVGAVSGFDLKRDVCSHAEEMLAELRSADAVIMSLAAAAGDDGDCVSDLVSVRLKGAE